MSALWPRGHWLLAQPRPWAVPVRWRRAASCREGSLNWMSVEFLDETNVVIGLDRPLLERPNLVFLAAKRE